jgi:hypothetical protein
MGQRVRIFIREAKQQTGRYVGETILPRAPKPAVEVCFEHRGRSLRGVIEQIVPADWEPNSELIPALHIVVISEEG